jgi:hypothetical protein
MNIKDVLPAIAGKEEFIVAENKNLYIVLSSKPHNLHYLKRYIKFINSCSHAENEYTEKHHIAPKAKDMFPEYKNLQENSWNLIALTARQHFVAHWILSKVYNAKTQLRAFYSMANQNNEHLSSIIYAKLKERFINSMTGENSPNYGKICSTEERKHKSDINKAYFKEHPQRGPSQENRDNTAERMRGVCGEKHPLYGKFGEDHPGFGKKRTKQFKKEQSVRLSGEKNGMYGTKHTEEWKKNKSLEFTGEKNPRYGKKNSPKRREEISQRNRDKTLWHWIHINGTEEFCTRHELCKKYNLSSACLGHVIKGRNTIHKGWRIKK